MRSSIASVLVGAAALVSAQASYNTEDDYGAGSSPFPPFSGDPFQKYDLEAEGIRASFIPYGARLTNLLVYDRDGEWQDVALGYDSGERYLEDTLTNHTYFGPVVGRYANRIKNGTFTIDGQEYDIPKNEHNGTNPLHGGDFGYDQRNWTIASHTGNSITFHFYDAAYEGFPGDLLNVQTYTLTDDAALISRIVSIPLNERTPVMLSNHIYWNLGAFANEDASTVLNDTLYMPYATRYVQTDGILIPNGTIGVTNGTSLDFTSPKTIGQDIEDAVGVCGTDCTGYDNAFILDKPRYTSPEDPNIEVLRLWSPVTGIQMSLETNMQAIQIYSCNGQDGTIPVKESQQHGNSSKTVEQYGCVVIEAEEWIDGINNPAWGREQYQIFSPTTLPAVNYQKYTFSTHD